MKGLCRGPRVESAVRVNYSSFGIVAGCFYGAYRVLSPLLVSGATRLTKRVIRN